MCGTENCYASYFQGPTRTHNYIIYKLGNNLVWRLDGRLDKYIYNLMHSDNITVQCIVKCKLNLCPYSVLSENYRYLCFKYKLGYLYWCIELRTLLIKITEYQNEENILVCNIIHELLEIRDGTC